MVSRTVRFHTRIEKRGINPFVSVSKELAKKCKPGWQRPLPVLVRLNGKPRAGISTNLMPAGKGDFLLYLNGAMREAGNVVVGDAVTIEFWFNAAYRNGPQHRMPSAFRAMLDANPPAKRNWQALSPSRKKEILRYFASLKSNDARTRNYMRTLAALSGNAGRFMGRLWKDGS